MQLVKIQLQNFRSYAQKEVLFSPERSLLVGQNAAGKTNILEAVYLLATGKSQRVGIEAEMVREDSEWARITGRIDSGDNQESELEIRLTRGVINGRPAGKKRYLVNQIPRRMANFVGILKAVFFRPEDLEIVLGSPGQRRAFLNNILIQTDYDYRRALLVYKRGLQQRNRLLQKIREGATDSRPLAYWDRLLIDNGDLITRRRQELIAYLNDHPNVLGQQIRLIYNHSLISRARLDQYYTASVAAGTTLVGPHRDDFVIAKFQIPNSKFQKKDNIQPYNLAYFGSRGEQRLAVLSLKLSELSFIEEKCGEKPVLLLDDIFSELDENHRRLVFRAVGKHQTIMTATETDWLPPKILDTMKIIKINS